MSLIADGKTAIRAMLDQPERFARIKDSDFASAAIKLAKKQVIASGQTREDLIALKALLGDTVFESTLDTLTAFQAKQLARRIDPHVREETIASCNMALIHIRRLLAGASAPSEPDLELASASSAPKMTTPPPKKNKYLGRKAFRTRR